MRFEVPIHTVGTPEGVRKGGILDHMTRMIEVRCLPNDLPSHLDADVTSLEINQSFHVSDLKAPEGVEVLTSPETTLLTVFAPKLEAVAEAETAEEGALEEKPAEPELVKKGKEKEEEESE